MTATASGNRHFVDISQKVKNNFFTIRTNIQIHPGTLVCCKRDRFRRTSGSFHSGGEGVQLTKRKNDQQDAGEPEVSHDGKYIYYSEDVSPGPSFQYNKSLV